MNEGHAANKRVCCCSRAVDPTTWQPAALETTMTTEFDQLQTDLDAGGVDAAIKSLADQLRQKKQYHELFEALKMQARYSIGLPLLYTDSGDELAGDVREKLEDGLIDACRDVGMMLLRDGRIREGWMYLRPVGDKKAAAEVLATIEPDEDNMDELVEVALSEGVDTRLGYRLVLDNYGTCNAITTYESQVAGRAKAEQQSAAELLVQHVYDELMATVKADIAQQEGNEPPEDTFRALVADREWLFLDNSYHIDTTHLASTVRFSRVLDDKKYLRLALDLTEYGRRLNSQFQYQGEEPFADIYPSHALYLQAVLGENVDEAIAYFLEKAETLDVAEVGTAAIEVYVDLLAKIGRYEDAIKATVRMMPEDAQPIGYAPSLLELSQQAKSYGQFVAHCREREDLLGFATGLMHAKLNGQ